MFFEVSEMCKDHIFSLWPMDPQPGIFYVMHLCIHETTLWDSFEGGVNLQELGDKGLFDV